MADSKLADLSDGGTAQATDLFYSVRDPSGTPLDQKLSASNVASYVQSALQAKPVQMLSVDHSSMTPGRVMNTAPIYTGTAISTSMGAANRIHFVPVHFGSNRTITTVGINVTSAGSAGAVVRLGIYNDSGGLPTTLIADWGTVATDSLGFKTLSISQDVVSSQWYWFALFCGVAVCNLSGSSNHISSAGAATAGGNTLGRWENTSHTYGALPASVVGDVMGLQSSLVVFWS